MTAPRILMLVENAYPEDTRVRNEATLLQSAGLRVSVICLGGWDKPRFELIHGVRVYRMPAIELFKKTVIERPGLIGRLLLKVKALIGYAFEYFYFTAACFLITGYVFLRHGFDVIHAHNPPDTLFMVALPYKLIGKKFVFDHHDLSPELYQSRYETDEGLISRILRFIECCAVRLADITIATNESYKQVQIHRGGKDPRKIFIVRNGPNEDKMTQVQASRRLRSMRTHILVYIGALNPQDGVDYLLRALHHLRYTMGRNDFYSVIMGTGDSLEDLRCLASELQLDQKVELTGFVPESELQANLAAADIALDPDPSSPLNDVSTWIKVMEYMAYSKPIVSFDLPETRFSAQDAAVYVRPNDETAFAEAIAALMDDPIKRRKMGESGRRRVENELQWSVVGENLLDAYRHLFPGLKVAVPLLRRSSDLGSSSMTSVGERR